MGLAGIELGCINFGESATFGGEKVSKNLPLAPLAPPPKLTDDRSSFEIGGTLVSLNLPRICPTCPICPHVVFLAASHGRRILIISRQWFTEVRLGCCDVAVYMGSGKYDSTRLKGIVKGAHDLIDMVTKEGNVPQNYGYPLIRR